MPEVGVAPTTVDNAGFARKSQPRWCPNELRVGVSDQAPAVPEACSCTDLG